MIKLNHINLSYERILIQEGNLQLNDGALTLLIGESGCGKSSLLAYISLLKNGQMDYCFDSLNIANLNEQQKSKLRKEEIGIVFQNSNLMDTMTIYQNIQLVCQEASVQIDQEYFKSLFEIFHLTGYENRNVTKLSTGQRQKAAIITALLKKPRLLILDEPTAYLDLNSKIELMKILKQLAIENQMMILVTSHEHIALEYADTIYEIKNQKINLIRQNQFQQSNQQISKQSQKKSSLPLLLKGKIIHLLYCLIIGVVCFVCFTMLKNQQDSQNFATYLNQITNREFAIVANNQSTLGTYNPFIETFELNNQDYEELEGCYPYVELYGKLDEWITIIPYFNTISIDYNLKQQFDSNTSGIYVSEKVYDLIKEPLVSLELYCDTLQQESLMSLNESVNGIVSNAMIHPYVSQEINDLFILMPYEKIMEIKGNTSSSLYVGVAKEIERLSLARKEVEKNNDVRTIVFDSGMENYYRLKIQDQQKQVQLFVSLVLIAEIIIVGIISLQSNIKRVNEFGYLLAIGFSKKYLLALQCVEGIISSFVMWFITIGILVGLSLFTSVDLTVQMSYISYGMILLNVLIPKIICMILIRKTSPERLLLV